MVDMLSAHEQTNLASGTSSPTLPDDQQLRLGAYSLLGALLRAAPDANVLAHLNEYHRAETPGEDEVATALRMLGLATRDTTTDTAADEYHNLFVGLGRGELVPYGSWYVTGFLMEEPLSVLRDDLAELGYERQNDVREPEDHAAALCEVMAMMIESGVSHERQLAFYNTHLQPWIERFFDDLENANNAVFYRAVARFGKAYFELEATYFSMQL